jgi:hypothetical protein
MEQSHGDNSLEIDITHTFEVPTMTRTTDEGCLSPPWGFRAAQYTLIRLSKVEGRKVLETLDKEIGTVNEVPHIEELSDGSWEICILKSHCHTAQDTLNTIFPGSDVDLNYNPVEPTANDLKIWDYDAAKRLRHHWCFKRAIRIVQDGWPAAAAYYTYLLEGMCGLGEAAAGPICPDSFDQPLVPTYQGRLESKEDAVYLLEACLQAKLFHARRGPRDGEAAIIGNVFVWEPESAGIDRWRDGMKWTVREEDGFKVGKAIGGSGLMKKEISEAGDAQTWARPSREVTLRPELVSVLFSCPTPSAGRRSYLKEIWKKAKNLPMHILSACADDDSYRHPPHERSINNEHPPGYEYPGICDRPPSYEYPAVGGTDLRDRGIWAGCSPKAVY